MNPQVSNAVTTSKRQYFLPASLVGVVLCTLILLAYVAGAIRLGTAMALAPVAWITIYLFIRWVRSV